MAIKLIILKHTNHKTEWHCQYTKKNKELMQHENAAMNNQGCLK